MRLPLAFAVLLLASARALADEMGAPDDLSYWADWADGEQAKEELPLPLEHFLQRMARRPRPQQFFGLMGKRDAGEWGGGIAARLAPCLSNPLHLPPNISFRLLACFQVSYKTNALRPACAVSLSPLWRGPGATRGWACVWSVPCPLHEVGTGQHRLGPADLTCGGLSETRFCIRFKGKRGCKHHLNFPCRVVSGFDASKCCSSIVCV
uniref:Tachykinin precursor 1 n=1 Tax=Anser cygnoides TaxID=8845 RepID=A0A8B9DHW7_ANSCY